MRKRLENHTKPNAQLFSEYLSIIKASKSEKWYRETRRLLDPFHEYIGEFPPTLELFTSFFQRFTKPEIRQSTRARYYYVFSAFFKWYDGSVLPFKIRSHRPVPQKVSDEEVDRLKVAIKGRATHKQTIDRDLLIVDMLCHTGLRLAELANLRVHDLRLTGAAPHVKVLQGKGGKDRDVNLNPYIRDRLVSFTRGMPPETKVIGITPKTIQSVFAYWAHKAAVPQLHPHSLRHKFATDILNHGGNIRDVQHLMGHESLATTEVYLAVTDEGLKDAVGRLDGSTRKREGAVEGEVSRSLEAMSNSLSDIKKRLETTSPGNTSAPSKASAEANFDNSGLEGLNGKIKQKDLQHFKASDKLINDTQMDSILLALETHSACSEYDYAKLIRYFDYFRHEERRFISHEIRLTQNELLKVLEDLILFIKLEFENESKSKDGSVMTLSIARPRLALDEQTKADLMAKKQEELLVLVKGSRDAYDKCRSKVHAFLLV